MAWTNSDGTIGVLSDLEGCSGDVQEGQQTLWVTTCTPLLWGCTWQSNYVAGPYVADYILQPNTYYYDPRNGAWNATPYQGLHCYGNWRYRGNVYQVISNQYGAAGGTLYYQLCGS